IEWDNFTGMDEAPRRLEDLPKWSRGGKQTTERGQKTREALQRFASALKKKSLGEVLDEFIESDSEADRRLAVTAMAATDNLERLAKALREAKHQDVWENGILALRHWIGRGPGQDQILYQGLIQKRKLSPVHAETVLQLLHSFGETELAQPETYQTLIDYLDHDLLPIRGLAYWHLQRLVPDGQNLG